MSHTTRLCDAYKALNVGAFSYPVTTSSPDAQRAFDLGLNFAFSFHHEAAIACFQEAARLDPSCAMAPWGVAYACGPNYNRPWEAFTERQRVAAVALGFESASESRELLLARSECTESERLLIDAMAKRYQRPSVSAVEELSAWQADFAEAMLAAAQQVAHDLTVACVAAEALMNLTPWALFGIHSGAPSPGARTADVLRLLEKALALDEAMHRSHGGKGARHVGLLHLYIHAMEMSATPEKALRAADALRAAAPDLSHLCHMASHIDVLCGNWQEALDANLRAVAADRRTVAAEATAVATADEAASVVYTLYRCHNLHFAAYAAMMMGKSTEATAAAQELERLAGDPELLKVEEPINVADAIESFAGVKYHVLVRFGRWHDILALPLPTAETADLMLHTTALHHYARGIAFAATDRVADAVAAEANFEAASARVPPSRMLFNNTCRDILGVAARMLRGEILYRRARSSAEYDDAFATLRSAATAESSLPYDEPWGWMQPVRHALGGLLLEQGRVEEALLEFEADLGLPTSSAVPRSLCHPGNVWALHGYVECLRRLQRNPGIAQLLANVAVARADVEISCSCLCRLNRASA